jgi:rare lipoprotein A
LGPSPLPPPSDDTQHPPSGADQQGCTESVTFTEEGDASWYGRLKTKRPRRTANGEIHDANAPTAAHRTLPFGTRVKVTNLANGRSTVVTINDRGPFIKGRIIDVSRSSAQELGFVSRGITRVRIEATESRGSAC